MLTFDAGTHTYRWKGVVVPSVTQVLADLLDWSHVPPEALEAAQLRGTEVHLMCQWHDEDRLELSEFTPEVQSYLPAWAAFLRDCSPNWRYIETMAFHNRLGFAGTPDRVGRLDDLPVEWVIDIKTGEPHPIQGLQTAGYELLTREELKPPRRRATVHLRPDGRYRLKEWSDPNDVPVFISLLTVRSWTRKHL